MNLSILKRDFVYRFQVLCLLFFGLTFSPVCLSQQKKFLTVNECAIESGFLIFTQKLQNGQSPAKDEGMYALLRHRKCLTEKADLSDPHVLWARGHANSFLIGPEIPESAKNLAQSAIDLCLAADLGFVLAAEACAKSGFFEKNENKQKTYERTLKAAWMGSGVILTEINWGIGTRYAPNEREKDQAYFTATYLLCHPSMFQSPCEMGAVCGEIAAARKAKYLKEFAACKASNDSWLSAKYANQDIAEFRSNAETQLQKTLKSIKDQAARFPVLKAYTVDVTEEELQTADPKTNK
jgi:hypothetical protein